MIFPGPIDFILFAWVLCSANLGFVLYAPIVLYFICNLEHDRSRFLYSKSPECKLDPVEGSLY